MDAHTDGWTDRGTHDGSMYRASIALRGKNIRNLYAADLYPYLLGFYLYINLYR